MKACIIGAGSSGIAAAKVLHERGIPFDCFEKGSGIGGNWRYENDNGLSAAYRSLHINTSRDKMAYPDFPMPADYPDFPHHSQILRYFEDYVDHFGFRDTIQFQTPVEHVAPQVDGTFAVTVTGPEGASRTAHYGAVLVANGHHWCPRWPDFPGTFDGEVLHAHRYKTPEFLAGKRVLVLGVGNSGCDIACEAARVAEATYLASRRGAHVVPKYILGQPLDAWGTPFGSRMPLAVQRTAMRALLWLSRGRQRNYGFPEPEYPFLSEHPTVSSELLNLVGHGKIQPKPNIERLLGDRVRFVDGSEAEVEVLIYATGYRIAFPFLDAEVVDPQGNAMRVYRHVVSPRWPGLYFIGLIQPLGAIMPLAAVQSAWVADLLEGRAGLPPVADMERTIDREQAAMQRRYVASPRHTIQVDFYPYERQLQRERRMGRKQAPRQQLQVSEREPVGV